MKLKKLSPSIVEGKKVFVRVDLNVPMYDGKIFDDSRLKATLKTVEFLIHHKASQIILCSHFGRPKGYDQTYSLFPLLSTLEKIYSSSISFGDNFDHKIHLLENVRFYEGEEDNSLAYAKMLASSADIYVNDAFSVSHRAHASIEAITHFLPSYAGFALAYEVESLEKVLNSPKRPSVAFIGGSKISTKIQILENLIKKVDTLVLGGGMANTFLAAQNIFMGKSLVEHDFKQHTLNLISSSKDHKTDLILPLDGAVLREEERCEIDIGSINENESFIDIGDKTLNKIDDILKKSKSIIWNGPFGVFEKTWGAKGTIQLATKIAEHTNQETVSVVGGGETAAAAIQAGVENQFTLLSLAGGAFLEFLSGLDLPGLTALKEK